MIKSVKFKNFYSFKETASMNFEVNAHAPDFFLKNNKRFSKVSAIFGANGSGKSNALIVFEFLKWFIVESFASDREKLHFNPFKTSEDKPSAFEVEFYIEEQFYQLSLEVNKTHILSEVLKSRENGTMIKLYSRQYIPSSKDYEFDGKKLGLEDNFIKMIRPNASVISTAKQFNHKLLQKISRFWRAVELTKSTEDIFEISRFYQNKGQEYFKNVCTILEDLDLGLSDIIIKKKLKEYKRGKMLSVYVPYGQHKSKGKTFNLPFPLESKGTLHLYTLLSFILPVLEQGGAPCVIDEIETSLHPTMLEYLINLFISEDSNPKGAQLIFTSHTPALMSILSKYQIFITEKNKDCESNIYRLDEVEGVRPDDNLFKKYMAGAYGGTPEIDF